MLTVAGLTVRVANNAGASELEPLYVGDRAETFAGGIRATVRATKRLYRIPSAWHTQAELDAIRAATGPGVFVTVVINTVTITAEVLVQEAAYIGLGGTVMRTFVLAIREQ